MHKVANYLHEVINLYLKASRTRKPSCAMQFGDFIFVRSENGKVESGKGIWTRVVHKYNVIFHLLTFLPLPCTSLKLLRESAEPQNTEQALKLLYKASTSIGGNARAQYQLALCLHRGGGSSNMN